MARVLTTRNAEYGNRLKDFTDKEGVNKDKGTVDWKQAGPYKFSMFNAEDPSQISKLTYANGDSVGPLA